MSHQPSAIESTWSIFGRMAWTVYVPFVFAGLGRGMLLPTIPLFLRDNGLSYGEVAVILAAVGIGAIAAGIPTGIAANRIGPYRMFIAATVVVSVSAAVVGVTTAVLALFAFRFAFGMGGVGLRIAIQTIVRANTSERSRGRAMAIVGGMRRASTFVGPVAGGLLADAVGYEWTFVVSGVVSAVGLLPFISHIPADARARRPVASPGAMRQVVTTHGPLLLLVGLGPALVMAVREGREVIVPLIGDDLGLSAGVVGVLVGVGTGADLLLFPVAGWLSDRFGRLFAIVPAYSLLGAGMLVLGISPTETGMIVAVVVMGIGNGLSAGTLLTFSADLAPEEPGPFLAAFGMMSDTGLVVAPLLVGLLADAAGLSASAFALSALMFLGVAWIVVAVGDTSSPTRPWLLRRLP